MVGMSIILPNAGMAEAVFPLSKELPCITQEISLRTGDVVKQRLYREYSLYSRAPSNKYFTIPVITEVRKTEDK